MTAYSGPLARLRELRGFLARSLNAWEARSSAGADADQIRASAAAVDAIDSMLAVLYDVRTRLVLERRADEDEQARRVDAMLAEARRRPDGGERA